MLYLIRFSMVLASILVTASTAVAQRVGPTAPTNNRHFTKQTFRAKDDTSIDYWLMSPAKIDEGQKYPLVLALHGRGGNTAAASELGSEALRKEFPCFVMAPAATRAGHWATPSGASRRGTRPMLPAVLEAMDALVPDQPIDVRRIYVTGQSMGGFGTFGALSQRPQTFAAAVPICGGWDPMEAERLKDIPLWVFHGDQDRTVPVERSRAMVQALQAAGGSPKYTEYEGVGHDSWVKAYSSHETWQWLFDQTRAK